MKVSKMFLVVAMMVVGTAAHASIVSNLDPNYNTSLKSSEDCPLKKTNQQASRVDEKVNLTADASDSFGGVKSVHTVK